MRSLYEKLNRLDDSLVESKRVVKKKKLTESDSQLLTNKITIALIDISGSLIRRKQELKDRALKDGADRIIFSNEGTKEIIRQSMSIKPEINVVVYTNNDVIEDPVLAQSNFFKKHPNFKFINVSLNNSDEMLTESVEDDKKKLFDAAASVKCKLDDDTIEYAMYDVDDFIENELVYCGKLLLSECPDMLFWRYVSDENFGSYCAVYESDEDFADAYYQISHDRVYDITDEVNGDYDYDDDIDEMLTESTEQYDLSTLVKDSINHLINNLGKDPMADDFGDDVCADLEDNYDIYVPENPVKYADWCDAVMSEVSRQLNNKEELTEAARNNKLQSIANKIIKYAEEHPESLRNFKYMYDYIDNLSQEARFEIPAKVGQIVLQDPENVTELEAEEFINMLLDETDVSDRLLDIKEANRKNAQNKLHKQFPGL